MSFKIKDRHSTIGDNQDVSLTGLVSLTNIPDLLQFLSLSKKHGVLSLIENSHRIHGVLGILDGVIEYVSTDRYSGLKALREIIDIEDGSFRFTPGKLNEKSNLSMPVQYAVMEAVRLNDENDSGNFKAVANPDFSSIDDDFNWDFDDMGNLSLESSDSEKNAPSKINKEIKEDMDNKNEDSDTNSDSKQPKLSPNERSAYMPQRDSTEVLSELLKVPGIEAVVISGRDGFVIETAGSSTRMNIDDVGAIIALTINSIEEMGAELEVGKYGDLFIEFGKAVIICRPVSDAICAIIAPDASKLGIIRHKTKSLYAELAELF
jgi:predicted regulator of Ras-like GTPase activity (Roadblock/LC7/MglB family)